TSTTTSVAVIAVDGALFDNDGMDNDDHNDKSASASASASASMTMMRPKKFNYRVLYVIRRTNPLYWDHPLLCHQEYQFASRIFSPARFFVKAGRAMPAILEEEERDHFLEETIANNDDDDLVEDMDWETTPDVKISFCDEDALCDDSGGVHFLPRLVTTGTSASTTHVPRDEANEIVFAKRKKKFRPCRLLVRSGRARRSIPKAGEAHFLQDPVPVAVPPVTSTNIVPRDDADGVARGCRIHASDGDCEIVGPGCDMIETKDIHIEIKIKTKTEITHIYIVPQEDANEIARGPRNDASVVPAKKKRKFRPCRLFLQSKRARRSIPEAEAHFLQVPVTSTNIVPRDDNAEGIGRGCQMDFSDNGNHDVQDASCQPQAINDAEKKESPMPESSAADDGSYFDYDIDDFADFDDCDRKIDAPVCDVIETNYTKIETEIEIETGSGHTETKSVIKSEMETDPEVEIDGGGFSTDGEFLDVIIVDCQLPERAHGCAEDGEVTKKPALQVQACNPRRSIRLAERRLREELQCGQEKQKTMDTDTGPLAPTSFGSTFVNGRRRSTRHLNKLCSTTGRRSQSSH
ncbi:MAG: hypothetical protein ACK5TW_00150, partial [Cyanobacteriota bacterium]